MPEMGAYAQAVARAVREVVELHGVSGSAIARHLKRAQSYASTRLNGRKGWTTDEIDQIATLIGMDVDEIWRRARDHR